MSEEQSSDAIRRLVKFMIALAIFGTIISLAVYFVVVVPFQQAAMMAPANQCVCNSWICVCP